LRFNHFQVRATICLVMEKCNINMERERNAFRNEESVKPISECEICSDLADRAFEAKQPSAMGEIASSFLSHVIKDHTGELMAVLAEKYIPIFTKKREMR